MTELTPKQALWALIFIALAYILAGTVEYQEYTEVHKHVQP